MIKKTIITLVVLIILSTIITFNSGINSTADECNDCTQIPSTPGDSLYCLMNPLVINSSTQTEITCGTPVTINIIDGIGPFTGVVSGNGYTLTKINDFNFSLSCNSGSTCGNNTNQTGAVATVTVSDTCGETATIKIRKAGGAWKLPWGSVGCGNPPWTAHYIYLETDLRWKLFKSDNSSCWCGNPITRGDCGTLNWRSVLGWGSKDLGSYQCERWSCP